MPPLPNSPSLLIRQSLSLSFRINHKFKALARYGTNGDRKRSPFRFLRIFLEIPVIVLSIYIAFVVDEYGRNKEEANLERKYLEELLEETRINEAELKADQDARRSQIELMDKLLETSIRTVDPDTLLLAMDQLLSIRIYSPTDAVYSDLVSSGNLRLIRIRADQAQITWSLPVICA